MQPSRSVRSSQPPLQTQRSDANERGHTLSAKGSAAKSYAQAAIAGAATLGSEKEKSLQAELGASTAQRMGSDEDAQIADEDDADGDDADITIPEEADFDTLQRNLRGLQRRRERKVARLAKQELEVTEEHDEIARHQATLVELQAAADFTKSELRETDSIMAEVSQKIAVFTAQRARESAPVPPPSQPTESSTDATDAKSCLLSALAGVQNYPNLPSDIQLLVRQFVSAIEAMRQTEQAEQVSLQPLVPGQTTIPTIFAKPQMPQGSTVVNSQPATAGVVYYDVSDAAVPAPVSASTITESEPSSGPMRVDGQVVGDKRKIEHVVDAERQAACESAGAQMCEEAAAPLAEKVGSYGPAPRSALGTPMDPMGLQLAVYVPPTRANVIRALREQVKDQAAKAQRERQLRSNPY